MRDIIESSDRINPINCRFNKRTLVRLQSLMSTPGGLGARLNESLALDSAFQYIDAAFSRFQVYNPYDVTNARAQEYLRLFDECAATYTESEIFL